LLQCNIKLRALRETLFSSEQRSIKLVQNRPAQTNA
jgi:hypothetical protein